MIDIVNGIGRFINDTTRAIMGSPQPSPQPSPIIIPNGTPCTTCGKNGITQPTQPIPQNNQPNNNGIVFNTEKQNTSATRRITPELEVNLRNTPYTNTSGMKFN